MLGKLIKYDLQAQKRSFFPLYICFIISSILIKILYEMIITGDGGSNLFINTFTGYFIVFHSIALFAMLILTAVFIVTYFYRSMTQDEAYLTMTLPVDTWQIIASKLICAAIWQITSIFLLLASFFLLAMGENFTEIFNEIIRIIYVNVFNQDGTFMQTMIFYAIVISIIQLFSGPMSLYFVIGVGHLFKKHRILGAILTYIGLSFVLQNINLIKNSFLLKDYDYFYESFAVQSYNMTITIVVEIVLVFIYFVLTTHIFKKKLNLE